MASSSPLLVLLTTSTLLLISSSSAAAAQHPQTLFIPVKKDPSTNFFLTSIKQRTPLIPINLALDLGGRFLWVDCVSPYNSSTYRPAHCHSPACSLAKTKDCSYCYSTPPSQTCNQNTCSLIADNAFDLRSAAPGELASDAISLRSTLTDEPDPVTVPSFLFTCVQSPLLDGLPKPASGVAGLGRTSISLPSQLASALNLHRKFALCLPSDAYSVGAVMFGSPPFLRNGGYDPADMYGYTPLLTNPIDTAFLSNWVTKNKPGPSAEYFIGLESIAVGGVVLPLNKTLLTIDGKGVRGTKISTTTPYMTLETSIYKAVTTTFARKLGRQRRVAAVGAFEYCFNVTTLRDNPPVGPATPYVELGLKGGAVWRMYSGNSMAEVAGKEGVLCLAMVDGGVRPRTSVVIGGHQLEDNRLVFDLEKSTLGFSGSLLEQFDSCAGFE